MIKKNVDKLKRKQERETFVGFRPSVMNHAKNYTRKVKHKKAYSAEDQAFFYFQIYKNIIIFLYTIRKYYNIFNLTNFNFTLDIYIYI